MAQLVEPLPHSTRDWGLILTLEAVYVEFARFPLGALVSSHIAKTCRFVG